MKQKARKKPSQSREGRAGKFNKSLAESTAMSRNSRRAMSKAGDRVHQESRQ